MVDVVTARTADLSGEKLREVRELLDAAFDGRFDETDWEHTVGGVHVLARADGVVVSHAAVVPRWLIVGERRLATGYVEGVATRPDARRRGYASRVMQVAGEAIGADHELGALSADVPELYGRLGWEQWLGPTFADAPGGRVRTPGDDGGVMVLRTPRTGGLDLTVGIVCDWRAGDVW